MAPVARAGAAIITGVLLTSQYSTERVGTSSAQT